LFGKVRESWNGRENEEDREDFPFVYNPAVFLRLLLTIFGGRRK
jgi:hypothetical protein